MDLGVVCTFSVLDEEDKALCIANGSRYEIGGCRKDESVDVVNGSGFVHIEDVGNEVVLCGGVGHGHSATACAARDELSEICEKLCNHIFYQAERAMMVLSGMFVRAAMSSGLAPSAMARERESLRDLI